MERKKRLEADKSALAPLRRSETMRIYLVGAAVLGPPGLPGRSLCEEDEIFQGLNVADSG